MKKRRHWTIYAVFLVFLATVGSIAYHWYEISELNDFEKAINEAGGAVHYDHSKMIELPNFSEETKFYFSDAEPVMVEISSGSHPIPDLLPMNRMPGTKRLSLNTSESGDHLVPRLSKLRHIEVLDLTGSEMTVEALLQLLENMPHLKEIRLTKANFNSAEIEKMKLSPQAAKLIF